LPADKEAVSCTRIFNRIQPKGVEILRKTQHVLETAQERELTLPTIHQNFNESTIQNTIKKASH